MKKNLFLAASLLTIGGALSACGTSETSEETATAPPAETAEETAVEETTEEIANEETPADEAATDETETDEAAGEDSVPEETAADESAAEETVSEETPAEETATDKTDSEQEPLEPAGALTQSDEQPYELNVLTGYELTSEEPGKDSLYLTEDSSVFMRIETFTPDTVNFSNAETQLKETLKAISPEAEIAAGQAIQNPALINSSSFEVPSAEGKVTGIVFEQENQIVRLTIFDSTAANATEDFIAMGQTISKTE